MMRSSCWPFVPLLLILFSIKICGSISTFDRDVTLTLPQKALLDEFSALVSHKLPHDFMREEMYLIRWLRAKNYNVREAADFLMKHIEWRKEVRLDGIQNEDWSDMLKDYKFHLESVDREGQPLAYLNFGRMDIRSAVVQGKGERLLRYVDKVLDEATVLVRTLGKRYKNITRGHLIMDFSGYNLVEHGCLRCVPVLLRMVFTYENHFPEYVDNLMLFNTPSIAEPLLNGARALLSPLTSRSLKIYGTNKKQNLEIMQQLFEMDEIPVELGGSKKYRLSSAGDNYDY